MRQSYRILYQESTWELVEKKSRFIATVRPVSSEAEAEAFIGEMKKHYWDASHNCYAWIIGRSGESQRCSDDGEPSQTAGRPMLDVLAGAGLSNVCAVVTRYFGGTLLGTGGLVRAYSGALSAGLKNARILTLEPAVKLVIETDYSSAGKLSNFFAQKGIYVLNREYGEWVVFSVLTPDDMAEKTRQEIKDLTDGRAKQETAGDVYYSIDGKEIHIF